MTLRSRLNQPHLLLAPGIYDALSAHVAAQAGFEALYLSGASIADTRLGTSDIGLTAFTEVCDTMAAIRERVDLPVIIDAGTGFGNPLNAQRTVRGFERAERYLETGVDALFIEAVKSAEQMRIVNAPFAGEMLDFDGLNMLTGTPELLAHGKQYEG